MFYTQILSPVLAHIANENKNNAFCIDDKLYTYGQFGEAISNIRGLIQARKISNKHVGLVTNNDLETMHPYLHCGSKDFVMCHFTLNSLLIDVKISLIKLE